MAGFYEEKGMVRYTMIIPKTSKEKLEEIAKSYKITQGEVVEVLIDQAESEGSASLGAAFIAKKSSKVKVKSSKRGIIEEMKGLTPAQLAQVQEAIRQAKAIAS
jgi:hypothetical protein